MGSDAISVVSALLEAGNVDTVYRDIYLERARTLLSPAVSLEDFQRIERERAALAELPLAIAGALEKANWPLVKELSPRTETLKQAVEGKRQAHRDRPRSLRRHGRQARSLLPELAAVHRGPRDGPAQAPDPRYRTADHARAVGCFVEGFLRGAAGRLRNARPDHLQAGVGRRGRR